MERNCEENKKQEMTVDTETDILIVVVVARVKVRSGLMFREENTSKYNRRVVVRTASGVVQLHIRQCTKLLYTAVLGFLTGTFLRRIPGLGLWWKLLLLCLQCLTGPRCKLSIYGDLISLFVCKNRHYHIGTAGVRLRHTI